MNISAHADRIWDPSCLHGEDDEQRMFHVSVSEIFIVDFSPIYFFINTSYLHWFKVPLEMSLCCQAAQHRFGDTEAQKAFKHKSKKSSAQCSEPSRILQLSTLIDFAVSCERCEGSYLVKCTSYLPFADCVCVCRKCQMTAKNALIKRSSVWIGKAFPLFSRLSLRNRQYKAWNERCVSRLKCIFLKIKRDYFEQLLTVLFRKYL